MKLRNLDNERNIKNSVESIKETRRNKILSDYRKYANLRDDESITLDNVDDWALNEACYQNNYNGSREDLINQLIN